MSRDISSPPSSPYTNPEVAEKRHRFIDFLKWRMGGNSTRPTVSGSMGQFPVMKPDLKSIHSPGNNLTVTWIGHATLLVQMDGVNILTDPIFSRRCSPVQWAGPERITPVSLTPNELPPIHLVLISHNHYDHLDKNSVLALGDSPLWIVPMGLKSWFSSLGIQNVVEMEWWDEHRMNNLTIVSTPSQHFSGRTPFDSNRTLWSSWAVLGNNFRFWFAGDTGYCSAFKTIGDKLGPFDLAAIPIGAYDPEWFMNSMHVTPEQAVSIHRDIRSRLSVGMHWGTFILTDEPPEEPPQRLIQALEMAEEDPKSFITLTHGETMVLK